MVNILLYDIEISPVLGHVWALWDQNVGLNQINKDWHLLSWSAKWFGEKEIMYADQRKKKDIENDKAILKELWKLLDKADIVITQNGIKFDTKKVNARFIYHGMQPPSSYRQIDTYRIAKKYFGFTSNKLEYLAKHLKVNHKKLTVRKFDGFELWKQCLAGNQAAWREMEKYNKRDVIVLEEVYKRLIPWDNSINFSIYFNGPDVCSCGSRDWKKNGWKYTNLGKYQRYKCLKCGSEKRSGTNEIKNTKEILR